MRKKPGRLAELTARDLNPGVVLEWKPLSAEERAELHTLRSKDNIPMQRYFDSQLGIVCWGRDPRYKLHDDVLAVKVDGEEHYIKIHDRELARAMKKLDPYQQSLFVQIFGPAVRAYAQTITSLNPEFWITNQQRDALAAAVKVGGEHGIKTAVKNLARTPGAIAGMWAAERGSKAHSEWQKWAEEFNESGARIDYFGLQNIIEKGKNLQNMMDEAARRTSLVRAKQAGRAIVKFTEDLNAAIENSTRLAIYRSLREGGATRKQAASYALNATVNFYRKGRFGPELNVMWMFSNANIQGTMGTFMKAIQSKGVRRILYGMMVFGYATAMWNRLIGGKDDDDVDRWDKISDAAKQRSFIFMLPGGTSVKIALPYNYNFAPYAGVLLDEVVHGGDKISAAAKFATSILDSFSPFGTGELARSVVPTALTPIVDLYANTNFAGAPIRPEQPRFGPPKPESELYFPNVNPIAREATRMMNELTGGNVYRPGRIDLNPEEISYVVRFLGGGTGSFLWDSMKLVGDLAQGKTIGKEYGDIRLMDVPFARRFVAEPCNPGTPRNSARI